MSTRETASRAEGTVWAKALRPAWAGVAKLQSSARVEAAARRGRRQGGGEVREVMELDGCTLVAVGRAWPCSGWGGSPGRSGQRRVVI